MKPWYKSKTIWTNILSGVGAIAGYYLGFEVTPEILGAWLIILNLLLRKVTNEELEW